ncbi:MAG TPA: hypothetical protein VD968_05250 [Pyrinomonadaceae bacterium]|nr:hypothetical protein [Pyrinomonadaceae bacterium]
MLTALTLWLAQVEPIRIPAYFPWVVLALLGVGALGWLIAAVLGFTRARVFGASTRWFAVASVCLLLYHLQWLVFAVYGFNERNTENVLGLAAFFNLFVAAGAVCAIVGFMRLTNPEP